MNNEGMVVIVLLVFKKDFNLEILVINFIINKQHFLIKIDLIIMVKGYQELIEVIIIVQHEIITRYFKIDLFVLAMDVVVIKLVLINLVVIFVKIKRLSGYLLALNRQKLPTKLNA